MEAETAVRLRRDGRVARITLSRPAVHNAFDPQMIEGLRAAFESVAAEPSYHAVVLSGEGRSFCAGADLRWMRDCLQYSEPENARDAEQLARMIGAVADCPVPVLARVQGAALGGGAGLVSACDIVIAASDARFGFTEARLGLAPAVVAPFVFARIGTGRARALFLTAEVFDAETALAIGLAHHVVPASELDAAVTRALTSVLANGPGALRACKALLAHVPRQTALEATGYTTALLAELRASPEGQEGVKAFLEKREPAWRAPVTG